MKFAFADPPYPGQAHLYADREDYGGEVDHAQLVEQLCSEYPEGWALSTASSSLYAVLPLCPPDVRIAAWVKPFCAWKKGVAPAYAWEPVIFRGGRKICYPETERDWVAANVTLKKGCVGAKPEMFCYWLFRLMGARPGDEFHDLFPGSGIVGECWERYVNQAYMPTLSEQHELMLWEAT